jgi:hypothetical protein
MFQSLVKQRCNRPSLIWLSDRQEAGVVDLFVLFPLTFLIGGLIIAAMALNHRARLRELAYRERIAMIERGLAPAPETDPARFERAFDTWVSPETFGRPAGQRHRTFGIMLLGLGGGLMMLIGFTAESLPAGFGVGGGVACLGIAFLVNGILEGRADPGDRRVPRQIHEPGPVRGKVEP